MERGARTPRRRKWRSKRRRQCLRPVHWSREFGPCRIALETSATTTDPLLSRLFPGQFDKGQIPSTNALAASTAFFVLISIFCAWVCARLAPFRAARHVLWFFIIGEVMGIAATI